MWFETFNQLLHTHFARNSLNEHDPDEIVKYCIENSLNDFIYLDIYDFIKNLQEICQNKSINIKIIQVLDKCVDYYLSQVSSSNDTYHIERSKSMKKLAIELTNVIIDTNINPDISFTLFLGYNNFGQRSELADHFESYVDNICLVKRVQILVRSQMMMTSRVIGILVGNTFFNLSLCGIRIDDDEDNILKIDSNNFEEILSITKLYNPPEVKNKTPFYGNHRISEYNIDETTSSRINNAISVALPRS